MIIETITPWSDKRRLGEAANHMVAKVDDWVVILDYDVSLATNLHWFDICADAIQKVGDKAGLMSCMTNRIGCPLQKAHNFGDITDMEWHRSFAKDWERDHHGQVEDITDAPKWRLSGFFMLTRRKVWEEVGGFPPEKFIGMDSYYHGKVLQAGYRVYLIKSLYVWHSYKRDWKNG